MNQLAPSLFLSHGSPGWILEEEMCRRFYDLAQRLAQPKAILALSGHWEEDGLYIGEIGVHSSLQYDFYGFGEELYQTQYPAPGADSLVSRIEGLLGQSLPKAHNRGLDHGVWAPLKMMYPNAEIPILQISLPRHLREKDLFELGRKLAPLREEGVMIIGSGSMTHNLHEINWRNPLGGADWVVSFEEWVRDQLIFNKREKLFRWSNDAPNARRNHPTPEHFTPLFVSLGAAMDTKANFAIEGFHFDTISSTAVYWE